MLSNGAQHSGKLESTPSLIDDRGPPSPEVTPKVRKMLAVIGGEMSRRQIQAALNLSDEKHFGEAYQQPAIALGLLEMTIPDKPNSRSHKYRLPIAGRRLLECREEGSQ